MKKNYTLSLDEEKVELIRPWLERKGLSFSGFVNGAVDEMAIAITSMNLPEDVGSMTLTEFMKAFSRMVKKMKEKS